MATPEALFGRILQIGIVVADVNETIDGFRQLLNVDGWNISCVDTTTGKGSNFHKNGSPVETKAKIAWVNFGNIELELIEPQDQISLYAEFLKDHGPGIHHVMLGAKDYENCVGHMNGHNVPAMGGGELQDTKFQMFDTRELLGFICEISDGKPLVPDQILNLEKDSRDPL